MTLGFRPEDVTLTEDTAGGMPVEVLLVEELGADAYVYGEVLLPDGSGKQIIVRTDGRRPPGKGETDPRHRQSRVTPTCSRPADGGRLS